MAPARRGVGVAADEGPGRVGVDLGDGIPEDQRALVLRGRLAVGHRAYLEAVRTRYRYRARRTEHERRMADGTEAELAHVGRRPAAEGHEAATRMPGEELVHAPGRGRPLVFEQRATEHDDVAEERRRAPIRHRQCELVVVLDPVAARVPELRECLRLALDEVVQQVVTARRARAVAGLQYLVRLHGAHHARGAATSPLRAAR